tara:strand:+ start:166 stop:384 length:219 start_codon:yes stop_codon:yes gene_type:complete
MKKTNVKVVNKSAAVSLAQVLGGLFLIFAIADFGLSWTGTNLTSFMGPASRFSPMIFGFIGALLLNAGKDDS